ncbi:hypothetical protein, partial [Serratia sp. M24T3]|uniref:hypothetical protein n=1 Tax=Serratia sp. M24T3 TaxID=932213 RepID=UPI00025BC35B
SVDKEGLVTAHGKGSTTLTVIEAESANYWGQQAEASVTVDVKDAMPLKATPVAVEFGAAKQQLNITGGNGGELSYRSLDEKVVSISAKGEMTFVGVGNTNIAVSQAATAKIAAPESITVSITIAAGRPSIENLEITGKGVVGSLLTSSYKYVGKGITEGQSTYQWMRGAELAISGARQKNYLLQAADKGHQIFVKVRPKNINGGYGDVSNSQKNIGNYRLTEGNSAEHQWNS